MKRLILLVAFGCVALLSKAQENTIPASSFGKFEIPAGALHQVPNPVHYSPSTTRRSTERTTSSTYGDWFDYWNENATTSAALYYLIVYPDSNIVDTTGSYTGRPSYNVFCHGFGMSFDPTDDHYYGAATGASGGISDPRILDTQSYQIDSFRLPYEYVHNCSGCSGADSMIIEFLVSTNPTPDSGTYRLRFNASATGYGITSDSTPRFATAIYTPTASALGDGECWDSIIAQKQRYALPLTGSGITFSTVNLRLSSPLVVGRGQKVIVFVHFKSANSFSLGTYISSANYLMLFAGSTAGATAWPQQTAHNASIGYQGSYQTALIAQNQSTYGTATSGFFFGSHNVLIPGVAFSTPDFSVSEMALHVIWPPMAQITGSSTVCLGATTTLSDAATGGTWSSSNPSVASINSSGVVTGVSLGTAVITYYTSSGSAYLTMTVATTPATPTISGGTTVCAGKTIALSASVAGGVWTCTSTSIATITTGGTVTGVAAGTALISYSIVNPCGTSYGTANITVNASPNKGTITGRDSVCLGHTTTLTESATGGTWLSAAPSIASVSATGVVSALASGNTTILYAVSNSTCSDTARFAFYVHCPVGISPVNGQIDENMVVYPNPTSGAFRLDFHSPYTENVSVTVADITGQAVKSFSVASNSSSNLNIDLAPGIYFVTCTSSHAKYVSKVAVVK